LVFFDKEIRLPAQEVWAVKVLDRIESPRMPDEIGEPGKQEMRLVPQVTAKRPICLTLEAFEAAAIAERLGGRRYADRRNKTLFMELIDLRLRQPFAILGARKPEPVQRRL
jgi:hypothetical protein